MHNHHSYILSGEIDRFLERGSRGDVRGNQRNQAGIEWRLRKRKEGDVRDGWRVRNRETNGWRCREDCGKVRGDERLEGQG